LDIERFAGTHPQAYAVNTVRNHLGQALVFDWESQAQKTVLLPGLEQSKEPGQNQTQIQASGQALPQTKTSSLTHVTRAVSAAGTAAVAAATTEATTATATAINIKTPAGPFRLLLEQQDQQIWLASVSRPDGMQRLYHPAPAAWSHRLGGSSLQAPGQ